jgi:hypothetical protein
LTRLCEIQNNDFLVELIHIVILRFGRLSGQSALKSQARGFGLLPTPGGGETQVGRSLSNLFERLRIGGRRRFSVRVYLAAPSVALLIPTLLIAWWLANLSAASEQDGIEQNVLPKADELSSFVDREVIASNNILIALASSPTLAGRTSNPFIGKPRRWPGSSTLSSSSAIAGPGSN